LTDADMRVGVIQSNVCLNLTFAAASLSTAQERSITAG
jgi:hypothetical protein